MDIQTRSQINNFIDSVQFSGVISIRKDNSIIYEKAAGFQDIKTSKPNNLQTKFGLASGAKTYTAIAILKLHEEGKLNIEDKISVYTKSLFSNYDSSVTIKHLLTHTSGIPDYLDEDLNEDLSHIPWSTLYKPSDYFEYFPDREMDFNPGSKFKYNNGAFIILAHIIDTLTGNYHEYVHNILENVGIKNTKYYTFDNLPDNTAKGYVFDTFNNYKTNEQLLPIIGGGDGGIFSNVDDIFLLWQSLFEYTLLDKKSVKLMIKQHADVSDTQAYGLGVWLQKDNENKKVEMIGEDQGVSFISSYNVSNHEMITIISNNQHDAWKLLNFIDSKKKR